MSIDIDTIRHEKSEKSYDIGIRFVIDVSLDTNNGVFRRYLVGNNPVNKKDPYGLYDLGDALDELGASDVEGGKSRVEWEWQYIMGQYECTAKCVLEVAVEDAAVHAILEGAAHKAASKAAKGLLKKGGWVSVAYGGYKAIKCFVSCGCDKH